MSHVSRRVYVNITYTHPDRTTSTEKRQDISVDIINSALATKINELAMTIPYTTPAYQAPAVGLIKEYSDAIEMLTREKIEPIFINFSYCDGMRKVYEVLGEKE